MKTKKMLWLFISLFLLTAPAMQTFAFGDEVEIALLEVSGFLPGNDPLGNPMQEDGMSVDQMVVKLLQKVEELTLYTIQQEERIKELEQRQK